MIEKIKSLIKVVAEKTPQQQVEPFVTHKDAQTGVVSIAQQAINIMFWLVAVIAVIMIIVGGIM